MAMPTYLPDVHHRIHPGRSHPSFGMVCLWHLPIALAIAGLAAILLGSGPPTFQPPRALSVAPISATEVRLAWEDDNVDELGVIVERSEDAQQFQEISAVSPDVTEFVDHGLEPRTTYYYRVRALSPRGDETWSDTASALTLSTVMPSLAPSELRATWTPEGLVQLSWVEHFQDELGLLLERSTDGSNFSTLVELEPDSDAYIDDEVAPEERFHYRLKALGADGDSAWSNLATATLFYYTPGKFADVDINRALQAPARLESIQASTSEIGLSWEDVADESAYVILVSWDGLHYYYLDAVRADVTDYLHRGASRGVTYYYRIVSVDASHAHSLPSRTIRGTVADFNKALRAPSRLRVAAAETGCALSWRDGSRAETGFAIEREVLGSQQLRFERIGLADADVTHFEDPEGLTGFRYRVQALSLYGDSRYSNLATYDPDYNLEAPVGLHLSVEGPHHLVLTWEPTPSDELGYEMQRSDHGRPFETIAHVRGGNIRLEDQGLEPGVAYHYRLRLAHQEAPFSDPIFAVTAKLGMPSAPVFAVTAALETPQQAPIRLLTEAASSSQINLHWEEVADNERGYILQRAGEGDTTFTDIATLNPNATRFSDTGLKKNSLFSYRFRSVAAPDSSVYSAAVTMRTLKIDPDITVIPLNEDGTHELWVVGTLANDTILVRQDGDDLIIKANRQPEALYAGPFSSLVVRAGDGDDVITVDGTVSIQTALHGEEGNDILEDLSMRPVASAQP